MPWVRRPNHSTSIDGNKRIFWVVGIFVAFGLGMLISYEWWGSTASVVELVEKELAYSRMKIHQLEKRVQSLETLQGVNVDSADVNSARGPATQKARTPAAIAVPQRTGKQP